MAVENFRTVQTRVGKRQTLNFLSCLAVTEEGDRLIGHRGGTWNRQSTVIFRYGAFFFEPQTDDSLWKATPKS